MTAASSRDVGVSLYYPNIDVEPNWLKASLLYWDTVRRIIPKEAEWEVRDPQEIRRALDGGCLVNTEPADYRKAASDRFVQNFLPLLDRGLSKAAKPIGDLGRQLSRSRSDGLLHQCNAAPVPYMHPEKISSQLIHELERRGCIKKEGNWLRVPRLVSGLYMVCLGGEMSRAIGIPLLTDLKEFSAGGEYVLFGESPSDIEEPRGVLLRLGLRFPTPAALAEVSMETVIAFNQKYGDERALLRKALNSIVDAAQGISDLNALHDFWNQKQREVGDAIKRHRRSMDEIGVTAGFASFLKISAPMLIKLIPNTEWIDTSALAVTGLALGVVDWWANLRGKMEQERQKAPWHYALRVEKTFKA